MGEPVRVLHIVGAMYPGGMENFIMNLYRNIDREKVQFDFIVHARKENDYKQEIEALGGRMYVIPRLTSNPIKSLKMLKDIVKQNHYQVVIRHTPNALIAPQLIVSKQAGAKTICHSHNVTDPQKVLHDIGKVLLPLCTDRNIACSKEAGKWMFGSRQFEIIHNAIDTRKFTCDENNADKIEKEFKLNGCHMYGNIANFLESKNHTFLLKVYKELALLDPEAKFFCLGEGALREEIEKEIIELGLQDKVILTGIRYDVECFMSRMDLLIFPSHFEGLPLTLIEAQASGLPILMSENVTDDVIVTEGLVEKLSLDKTAKEWADRAYEIANKKNVSRACQFESISRNGYDIQELSRWYQNYILELCAQ